MPTKRALLIGAVETTQIAFEAIARHPAWDIAAPPEPYRLIGSVRHSVTHHRLTLHVCAVEHMPKGAQMFPVSDLPALPAPQKKAISLYSRAR